MKTERQTTPPPSIPSSNPSSTDPFHGARLAPSGLSGLSVKVLAGLASALLSQESPAQQPALARAGGASTAAATKFDLGSTLNPALATVKRYRDGLSQIKAALQLRAATVPAEKQAMEGGIATLDLEISAPFSQNLTKVPKASLRDGRQYSALEVQRVYSKQLEPVRERLKQEGMRAVAQNDLELAKAITRGLEVLSGTSQNATELLDQDPSRAVAAAKGDEAKASSVSLSTDEYPFSVNGRSYILVDRQMSLPEADALAKSRGLVLASIKDLKQDEVSALLKACYDQLAERKRPTENKWVRLGDRIEKGKFVGPDGLQLTGSARRTIEKLMPRARQDLDASSKDTNLTLCLNKIEKGQGLVDLDRTGPDSGRWAPYVCFERPTRAH